MASTTTTPVQVSTKSIIMLHEWWLEKGKKGGIVVGGIASMGLREERESVFLSTVITERHEANVLETQDGITLILRGFINASRSSLNGFPSHISQHFLLGFPFDWIKFNNSMEEKESQSSLNDYNNNNIEEEEDCGGLNRRRRKKKMVTISQAPLRRSPRLRNHSLKVDSLP